MDPIVARYRLDVAPAEAQARAEALALEQSVELPDAAVRDPRIRERVIPRILSIEPLPDGAFAVELAFDAALSALDAAGLLNLLFGNASLLGDVRLVDVGIPEELRIGFGGPRHGVAGLRALCDVPDGPLTASALKPLGLGPDELAALAEQLALGGIDLVKDDHGLGDHPFCPFAERVAAVCAALDRVAQRTGRRTRYAPHVVGDGAAIEHQLDQARQAGADAVLCCPMLIGPAAFHRIARRLWDGPVLAHPALAGSSAIAPELLVGRLFRLFGADATIYPHVAGRFAWSDDQVTRLLDGARGAWPPLRPALPVPAGGMTLERVPELARDLGPDVMLLIGGSLHVGPEGLVERTRAFVEAARSAGEGGTGP